MNKQIKEANARLIAAAPELLAAAEARAALPHDPDCPAHADFSQTNNCNCTLGMSRAAIRKAKGEQP